METNPVVPLLLALGLIIIAARLGGAAARALKQPRVLGELLVGIVLGPTLLDILHWPLLAGGHLEETVAELAEIGVVLLMFIVGLEVNLGEMRKVGRVGIFAGVGGGILPVLLTLPIIFLFSISTEDAVFAGVVLAATSVSISAQVLLELGVLRTKEGNALLATALIDDVLALLLVSLATALLAPRAANLEAANTGDIILIVVRMAAFLIGGALVAWFVLPRIIDWIADTPSLEQSYGIPAFALAAAFIFAWAAEQLGGVAIITGSFLAGVGFSQTRPQVRHEIEDAVTRIAYAFLVPIFFVNVGLQTNLRAFQLSALPLALVLLVGAVVSKIVGCGGGALLGGFKRQEALRLGVCMISRGEVGLIIAGVALNAGVFTANDPLYTSLFLVIILTTLMTPPLVRLVFPRRSTVVRGV